MRSAEQVTHVHIFFLLSGLGLLLLFLHLLRCSRGAGGGSGSSGGGRGTASTTEVEEGGDVLAVEGLGEVLSPVVFDLDVGSLDELGQLVACVKEEVLVMSWPSSWRIRAA